MVRRFLFGKEAHMQEEIEEKTVRLAISTTRLTGRALLAGIRAYLRHRANAQLADIDEHIQGKQSVDELIKQNQGVSSMVVGDEGIRTFERIAKKYGVDFAVMKDKAENPPVYTAFFKARDTDAMEAVVNEYSKKMVKKQERPSVLAKLRKFIEIAKKQPNKHKNRTQEMTR